MDVQRPARLLLEMSNSEPGDLPGLLGLPRPSSVRNAVRVGHRPPPEAGHSSLDGGERGVILLQVENDIQACKGRRTTARSFRTTDLYCTDSALSVP